MSDLTLPIVGITTLLGYFFSQNTNRQETVKKEQRNSIDKFDKPNGENIYSSNVVDEANREILERSTANYHKSRTPAETGIIPPLYNTYSIVGSDIVPPTLSYKDLSQINDINKIVDIKTADIPSISIEKRPMFKSEMIGKEDETVEFSVFDNKIIDNERSLLTGTTIEKNHNNLVPFFGSNMKQNVEAFTNTTRLDLYTGNTSTYIHKKEVVERFEPQPENIYGAPTFTTTIETDRFIPSLYRQNEKPFEDEKIFALRSGIYENDIRPEYKTVNELRPGNKPKLSYESRIQGCPQVSSVRGILGEVEKRGPEKFYETKEDSHWFKGPGSFTGITSRDNYETNFKDTSRQVQHTEYVGGAQQMSHNKPMQNVRIDNSDELFDSIIQPAKRQNFENDYVRNIGGYKEVHDYGKANILTYETERDSTGEKSYTLNANRGEFGHTNQYIDDAKSTIRQTTIDCDNRGYIASSFNNGKTEINEEGVIDYNPRTTQKETLVNNKYIGHANKDEGYGYVVTEHDAKTTMRQTTHQSYIGGSNSKDKEQTSQTQYNNAMIRNRQEKMLLGERASGPQQFKTVSGKDSVGNVQLKEYMKLKEQRDNRDLMNGFDSSVFSGKNNIGMVIKHKSNYRQLDDRCNAIDIKKQLSDNPFYIN